MDLDKSNPDKYLEAELLVLLFEGDNPMHAECSCHKVLNALKFCCVCKVGSDSKAEAQSAEAMKEFLKPGKERTLDKTKYILQRSKDIAASGGPKSDIEKLSKETGTGDLFNFFSLIDCMSFLLL